MCVNLLVSAFWYNVQLFLATSSIERKLRTWLPVFQMPGLRGFPEPSMVANVERLHALEPWCSFIFHVIHGVTCEISSVVSYYRLNSFLL